MVKGFDPQAGTGKLIPGARASPNKTFPDSELRLENPKIKSSISGEARVSLSRRLRDFRVQNKTRFTPTFDRGIFAALL